MTEPPAETPAVETAAPAASEPPEETPAAVAATEGAREPEPPDAAAAPGGDRTEAPPEAPGFDVVRIDPKGKAVFAGRAAPGAEVTVRSGDEVLGTATADSRGEWVLVPGRALAPGAAELNLASKLPEMPPVESESVVLVDVPATAVGQSAPPREVGAVVVPGEAGDAVVAAAAAESGAVVAPAAAGEVLAVLVPRMGEGVTRVLQAPSSVGVGVAGATLRLEAVDYDAAGNLVLSGRAAPGTEVRAFVDTAAVGVVEVSEGRWRLAPEDAVAPGRHALRIEQIGEGGVVLAELSLPFSRAGPDELALDEGQVVVQPGNSLWRIARRTYGQGIRFTVIYEANQDQIGDPDLIFPGQIFALPDAN